MWPDRVSNPGPLTYESGALPTPLRGPAHQMERYLFQPNKSMLCAFLNQCNAELQRMSEPAEILKTFHKNFAGEA